MTQKEKIAAARSAWESMEEHLEELRADVKIARNRTDLTHKDVDALQARYRDIASALSPIRRAAIFSEMKRDLGGIRWSVEERIRASTGVPERTVM